MSTAWSEIYDRFQRRDEMRRIGLEALAGSYRTGVLRSPAGGGRSEIDRDIAVGEAGTAVGARFEPALPRRHAASFSRLRPSSPGSGTRPSPLPSSKPPSPRIAINERRCCVVPSRPVAPSTMIPIVRVPSRLQARVSGLRRALLLVYPRTLPSPRGRWRARNRGPNAKVSLAPQCVERIGVRDSSRTTGSRRRSPRAGSRGCGRGSRPGSSKAAPRRSCRRSPGRRCRPAAAATGRAPSPRG